VKALSMAATATAHGCKEAELDVLQLRYRAAA
jgi:hypothetical protein